MSDAKIELGGGSIGLPTILTVLFVVLKVFDKIDWSWWWVFSPLWISALLIVGVIGVVLAGACFVAYMGDKK